MDRQDLIFKSGVNIKNFGLKIADPNINLGSLMKKTSSNTTAKNVETLKVTSKNSENISLWEVWSNQDLDIIKEESMNIMP